MVTEIDIYRKAKKVISRKKHPEDFALSKCNRLYEIGDTEKAAVWARVRNAIEVLLKDNPDGVFH